MPKRMRTQSRLLPTLTTVVLAVTFLVVPTVTAERPSAGGQPGSGRTRR